MNNTFAKALLWKMVIAQFVMYSLLSMVSAFLGGVAQCDFPSLTNWNKFLILLSVLSSWLVTMSAFFDKSISSLKEKIKQEENNSMEKTITTEGNKT